MTQLCHRRELKVLKEQQLALLANDSGSENDFLSVIVLTQSNKPLTAIGALTFFRKVLAKSRRSDRLASFAGFRVALPHARSRLAGGRLHPDRISHPEDRQRFCLGKNIFVAIALKHRSVPYSEREQGRETPTDSLLLLTRESRFGLTSTKLEIKWCMEKRAAASGAAENFFDKRHP